MVLAGGEIRPLPLVRLIAVLDQQISDEQAAVVTAPLAGGVVVAGAGSGKTATMVARVVWLIASGYVAPSAVLGLTFTTKAADELAGRVRRGLHSLATHNLLPTRAKDGDLDLEPTVSTYHAYAARLVRDNALRLGREPAARLITPATAWQLAARAVGSYDGPMDDVTWAESTVIHAVLLLAGDLSEHLAQPAQVREVGRWLQQAAATAATQNSATRDVLRCQQHREQLLPLVERYTALKRDRDLLDFGDAVALAAQLARDHPAVAETERSTYRVVLLDEYQDTGSAQELMLSALFGAGHPVTAVGDPCQSIYGWRGASAGTLRRFATRFAATEPARTLSTTYRNGGRILLLANDVSRELRAEGGLPVPALSAAPGRGQDGQVRCALLPDVDREAAWVAQQVRAAILSLPADPGRQSLPADPGRQSLPSDPGRQMSPSDLGRQMSPSDLGRQMSPSDLGRESSPSADPGPRWSRAAVLCRKRSMFPRLRAAFEALEVPVEVVGLGGLLDIPEVADIVATMRVLDDPTADPALLRLLTGPRWRIGPRDLAALGRRARALVGRSTVAQDPIEAVVLGVDESGVGSLVDALDDLPAAGPDDPLSPEGRRRLPALAAELAGLRHRLDQPLPDLVADIERTLGLDIEVPARLGAGPPAAARADLDAFADAAAGFAFDASQDGVGGGALSAFLAFLAAAEEEENGLDAGTPGAADTVKLMTIHAAKGLEWPVVAVPGLSRGDNSAVFPARPRTATSWTANPRLLPFSLRGDVADLPGLRSLEPAEFNRHKAEVAERNTREERRLAYVAVTRAEHVLLCSGYHWGPGKKVLGPSEFLLQAQAACESGAGVVDQWEQEPPSDNPVEDNGRSQPWPSPTPPAPRPVQLAARRVRELIAGPPEALLAPDGDLSPAAAAQVAGWDDDLRRLAEEARRRSAEHRSAVLPEQLSVTALVALRRDPVALARALLRPVPQRPSPASRRGTAFHTWLEKEVFGQPQLLDPDELPGAADDGAVDAGDLGRLQAQFRASVWWGRNPYQIEVPFEMELEGVLVRGRLDAVYREGADHEVRYDIVDWKTGRLPTDGREAAAVQLAAYRLAWHRLSGAPLDRIAAAFHYVAYGVTIRPADLLDEQGLADVLRQIPMEQP